MSKTDDLRALREARYAQRSAGQTKPVVAPTPRPPAKPTQVSTEADATDVEVTAVDREPEAPLCGHRAISGRTCTREHGHAAKSHRYS